MLEEINGGTETGTQRVVDQAAWTPQLCRAFPPMRCVPPNPFCFDARYIFPNISAGSPQQIHVAQLASLLPPGHVPSPDHLLNAVQ